MNSINKTEKDILSSSSSQSSTSSTSSFVEGMEFYFATTIPSKADLSISILNTDDLKESTKQWFGYPFPSEIKAISDSRFRGNLTYKEAVWGISELCSGSNSNISNAVVFEGTTLVIKISPEGHAVGYLPTISNSVVFSKTTLEITVYDVANGAHKTLVFQNFQTLPDALDRYIVWKIPNITDDATDLYLEKGFYGLYTIEIKEKNEWFLTPDWQLPINIPVSMQNNENSSFAQFFSIWWKRFLTEVDIAHPARNVSVLKNINFITSPVLIDDGKTTQEVFDQNTTFPLFKYISNGLPVDISDDDKDAIIKSNSWSIAASQLPILTSDYFKAKLLGLGIAQSQTPPTTDYLPYVRNSDYTSESIGTKEIYNLNGVPVVYNLHNFMSNMVQNHLQSSSKLYNPTRCEWIDKSSNQSEIGFAMSSLNTIGAETTGGALERTIYTTIDASVPKVEKINSTISNGILSINIVVAEENKVSKISYGIAVDNESYRIYVDNSGKTRQSEFELERQFKEKVTPYSFINIQIGIEDNDGRVYYYYDQIKMADSFASSIDNLIAFQRMDGSKLVDVYYDYVSDYEISPANIELQISSDYGDTFLVPITSASGDIGGGISTGTKKHIIWNPLIDLPNFTGAGIVFSISIRDVSENPVVGRSVSGSVVVDSVVEKPYVLLPKNVREKYYEYNGEDIKNDGIFSFESESYDWESSLSSRSSSSQSSESSSSLSSFSTSSRSSSSNSSSSMHNHINIIVQSDLIPIVIFEPPIIGISPTKHIYDTILPIYSSFNENGQAPAIVDPIYTYVGKMWHGSEDTTLDVIFVKTPTMVPEYHSSYITFANAIPQTVGVSTPFNFGHGDYDIVGNTVYFAVQFNRLSALNVVQFTIHYERT